MLCSFADMFTVQCTELGGFIILHKLHFYVLMCTSSTMYKDCVRYLGGWPLGSLHRNRDSERTSDKERNRFLTRNLYHVPLHKMNGDKEMNEFLTRKWWQ